MALLKTSAKVTIGRSPSAFLLIMQLLFAVILSLLLISINSQPLYMDQIARSGLSLHNFEGPPSSNYEVTEEDVKQVITTVQLKGESGPTRRIEEFLGVQLETTLNPRDNCEGPPQKLRGEPHLPPCFSASQPEPGMLLRGVDEFPEDKAGY